MKNLYGPKIKVGDFIGTIYLTLSLVYESKESIQ